MRPLEIVLSLANVLAFGILAVLRPRGIPRARFSATVPPMLAGAQALFEGFRWQMVPAYLLGGAFLLIALWRGRRPAGDNAEAGRGNRHAAGLGVGLGTLGLAVSIALPIIVPVFRFPRPTGRYAVGTVTYHWVDASRHEFFSADPNAHRELMVQIWYPAKDDSSAPRAPYLHDANAASPTLARLFHLPEFAFGYFKYITTNSIPFASPADAEPSFPVLIYLEGLTSVRQGSTVQLEELASHGYIVAAIDQPYAAATVVFPDGRQVPSYPGMRELVFQSIDPTSPSPTVNGRSLEEGIIPYLAQDALFTLEQLTALNQTDPNGILAGRMDLQRVGVVGDSLGGVVLGEACLREPRFRACLVEDTPLTADVVRAGLRQPTMWISRDVGTMHLEGWSQKDIDLTQNTMREVYERLPGDGYLVLVPGIFHLNFNDTPIYSPLTSLLRLSGPIDAMRAYSIINAYSLAFFDHHLKGQPTALLDGPSEQYPEVHFETRRPR